MKTKYRTNEKSIHDTEKELEDIKSNLAKYATNLNEVEQLIRAAGYDCVCAGTDDNLKIYVTKLDDKDQIRSYIAERTGINQAGFTVVYVEEIPRNKSGKVLYPALAPLDTRISPGGMSNGA